MTVREVIKALERASSLDLQVQWVSYDGKFGDVQVVDETQSNVIVKSFEPIDPHPDPFRQG